MRSYPTTRMLALRSESCASRMLAQLSTDGLPGSQSIMIRAKTNVPLQETVCLVRPSRAPSPWDCHHVRHKPSFDGLPGPVMLFILHKKNPTSRLPGEPAECVCMCVCVYVYVCICVYVYVCICVCVYMCICVCVYMCIIMYAYVLVCALIIKLVSTFRPPNQATAFRIFSLF